jgi:predicted acylesterase/phospholipase RssA
MSGGGAAGLLYIPSIKILEKYNYLQNIDTIIGTSIGALVGVLYYIGYTGTEINEICLNFNIEDYLCISEQSIFDFFKVCGMDTGDRAVKALKIFFKYKGYNYNTTFKELYEITGKKLVITGTNLTTNKLEYFNYETQPDMSVILAVRISICIPCYFKPVIYKGSMYIDGGVLGNFPINYLTDDELKETIGMYTFEENEQLDIEDNIINYILTIYKTIQREDNFRYGYMIKFKPGLGGLEFGVSSEKKKEYFKIGEDITLKYIANNLLEI